VPTEGEIKNGHSSKTGNIGYTRHRAMTKNKHDTENKNGEQHGPNQNKTGGEPRCSLRVGSSCF
jgi:hypothetical protein